MALTLGSTRSGSFPSCAPYTWRSESICGASGRASSTMSSTPSVADRLRTSAIPSGVFSFASEFEGRRFLVELRLQHITCGAPISSGMPSSSLSGDRLAILFGGLRRHLSRSLGGFAGCGTDGFAASALSGATCGCNSNASCGSCARSFCSFNCPIAACTFCSATVRNFSEIGLQRSFGHRRCSHHQRRRQPRICYTFVANSPHAALDSCLSCTLP